jgi:hypothetical protein
MHWVSRGIAVFNSLVSITDSLSFFGDIASGAQALSQDGFGILDRMV